MENQKKNTSGLIPYKKGQSGNPSGGRAHAKYKLRHVTREKIAEIGSKVLTDEVIEECILKIVEKIKKYGNPWALDALLNRVVGPVPTQIQSHQINVVKQLAYLDTLSNDDLIKLATKSISDLQSQDEQTLVMEPDATDQTETGKTE